MFHNRSYHILTKTKLTTKKTNIFFFLRGKNSLTYKTTKRILPLREVHQTSSPKIYLQSYAIYLNSPNSLNFFKRKWRILIHFKTYTPLSSAIDGDCYLLRWLEPPWHQHSPRLQMDRNHPSGNYTGKPHRRRGSGS